MKKTLLPLLLFSACLQGHADELGYTTGAYSRSAFFSLGTGNRQGLAIRLPHEKLALLKGKQITGVTAIYGTKNLEGGTVTAFVTTDLNATPIAEKAQAITSANIPSTTAKWTETTFDTPYTITGEEECLYIGYTGVLTGNYALYSTDRTMDAEGRTFAIVNDTWTDLNGKGRGMANLKAVVDEMPEYADVLMKSARFSDYYLAGEQYTLLGEVFNAGTETITSLDVEVTSDQVQTLQLNNLELLPGKTLEITLPDVTAENAGATDLAMKIVKVNGKEDADMTDNGYAEHVFFYPQNMERSMLVESFTGQKCSNCPAGHTTLKRVLEEIPQQTVEVTHHAGYFPDNFTMNEDLQYTLFYGTSSTYAPAFILNRYPNAYHPLLGCTVRQYMAERLQELKEYADAFDLRSSNLLLCGSAGLGKTHAALAIAGIVLDKGYDVIYISSQELFGHLDKVRRSSFSDEEAMQDSMMDAVLSADLLILDDLGTEYFSQYVASCLYTVLNSRIGHRLPTIYTTNITDDRVFESRYTEKIASRLTGSCERVEFYGSDIRKMEPESDS